MRSALYLSHGVDHVSEWVALPIECSPLEFPTAVDHFAQHDFKIIALHLAQTTRRAQHRRKSNAVETHLDELVERAPQLKVGGRNGHPRRYLHATLQSKQGSNSLNDRIEASAPALEGSQQVVCFPWPVQANGYREAVSFKEFCVRLSQQSSVGSD